MGSFGVTKAGGEDLKSLKPIGHDGYLHVWRWEHKLKESAADDETEEDG